MREKALDNYFMIVGRLAIDVVKKNGVANIIVADRGSNIRVTYDINMRVLATNTNNKKNMEYINSVVKRNLENLQLRAKEMK